MEITHIPIGERLIPLAIRRHQKARRISLRLSAARDGIVMTLPRRASLEAGMKFLSSQQQWVLANVDGDRPIAIADGTVLPILGKEYIIRHVSGRGLTALFPSPLTGQEQGGGDIRDHNEGTRSSLILPRKAEGGNEAYLYVYGNVEFLRRRVKDFLKKHLHAECLKQSRAMAALLGKSIREVRIRDTRSRWGSCTTGGSLTFNWRLVFAEPYVLHYLIAHEVAHLIEMNHSKRFWEVVAQLNSDMMPARQWLKQYGHTLYRYL